MQALEFNISQQLRLVYMGSTVTAIINFFIVLLVGLPYLPQFYCLSALVTFLLSRYITMRHFILGYFIRFLLVTCQSFLSVYVIGDDCGIQLYLLALLILSNYIRFTGHSKNFQKGFMAAACFICVLCYMISDEGLDRVLTPLTQITEEAEIFFTLINVLGSLALLIFVSSIFVDGHQRLFRTLIQSNDRLQSEATLDSLTELKNRRGIQACLDRAYRDWQKNEAPLTIALGDIDHFKQLNDTYGHEAGDLVLRQIARLITERLGGDADICRWGGEEFLFLLRAGMDESLSRLEDLRRSIENLPIVYQQSVLHVSLTIGVAQAHDDCGITDLILASDRALYLGKNQGRNQVVAAALNRES